MNRLHAVPVEDEANGVFVVARMLAKDGGGRVVDARRVTVEDVRSADEVWVHGMWLPREWRVCRMAIKAGKPLVRMTHGSLSPVYLTRQGKWKKRLVSPIERYLYSKTSRVVVTCEAEAEWCRAWGVKCPIEVLDLKRFFKLDVVKEFRDGQSRTSYVESPSMEGDEDEGRRAFDFGGGGGRPLHILYLGRRHPLKGVEFLESAVREINDSTRSTRSTRPEIPLIELRIVSEAFGEEKEKVWDWCDVLVLPTLSENFGLVVAEALERGKRVITTDGAPAWDPEGVRGAKCGVRGAECGEDDRSPTTNHAPCTVHHAPPTTIYLRGFRDGTDEERVALLADALKECLDWAG